jgi:manganese efflux pump family protein
MVRIGRTLRVVVLKLLVLVLPLSLDTFAVSAAMGVAGLDRRERIRLTVVLAGFEATMPLLGFLAGAAVGARLGGSAEWLAIAVLAVVGVYMLLETDDDDADRLRHAHGWSMVGLGLGVSVDELAVGVAVGLAGLPILLVVVVIAAQACIATQAGTMLGSRIGERVRGSAERVAGVVLLLLAVLLAVSRLTGIGG